MIFDKIELVDGSSIQNLTVPSGTDYPSNPDFGELFYFLGQGLEIFDGTAWSPVVGVNPTGGGSFSAGTGISISAAGKISCTLSAAGAIATVQISDGTGKFASIPAGTDQYVLTSNGPGEVPTWEPAQVSGGTVSSVSVSGGNTGFTAGPTITSEGTITLDGVLNIEHGGTGATSKKQALINLLPTQAGKNGSALVTDGSGNLSWVTQPGTAYTAGTGLRFNPNNATEFESTVADNTGTNNRVQISNGDGTLSNLPAGTPGYVLTSNGGAAPTWEHFAGTVTDITINRNPYIGLYISPDYGFTEVQYSSGLSHRTTQSAAFSLQGVLDVKHGGTGLADDIAYAKTIVPGMNGGTAGKFLSNDGIYSHWALPIPDQTGHAGKFLTTNGSSASWMTPAGGGTVTSVGIGGGTGLSGAPVTQAGNIILTGVLNEASGGTGGMLSIAHGGTGASTASAAINNLVPSQTGNAGRTLTTDGTSVSWTSAGAGSVRSIDIDPAQTGLSVSGGPITDTGTFTLGGTLSELHGGTGASSFSEALKNVIPAVATDSGKVLVTNGGSGFYWEFVDNLSTSGVPPIGSGTGGGTGASLPSQTGNAGKYLSTDGTNASWTTIPTNLSQTTGVLPISAGGTGVSTQADLTTLVKSLVLPTMGASTNGKVLSNNGTSPYWANIANGTVTSVDVNGGVTGLTFSGGPITDSGAISLDGVLGLANGGTGATSAIDARINLLPAMSGNAGRVLSTNGTDVVWSTVSALQNIAGGASGNIQFNNGSSLSGSANLTYDSAASRLTITKNGGSLLRMRSTSASESVLMDFGRAVSDEARMGILGAASEFTSAVQGDFVVKNSAGNLMLGTTSEYQLGLFADGSVKVNASQFSVVNGSTTTLGVNSSGALIVNGSTGSAGQVLASSGTSSAPAWITPGVSMLSSVTASATTNLDCSYDTVNLTLASNITALTFSNVPSVGKVFVLTLYALQDATGARTIAWPASVKWAGAAAPALTITPAKTDIFQLTTFDGGTTWFATTVGLNF